MDDCHDLPEHILFDILLLLPVLSVLKFKYLCKSWFAIIGSRDFITKHRQKHSGNDEIIATYRHGGRTKFCLLSGWTYHLYSNLYFEEEWYSKFGDSFNLIDSSNGLICLQNEFFGDLLLWNPESKHIEVVPSVPHEISKAQEGAEGMQCFTIGFGFDSRTKDYKVVRFPSQSDMPFNQVAVYSLRINSWRVVSQTNDVFFTSVNNSIHASSSGRCIWGGQYYLDNVLVEFNLINEELTTFPMPYDREFDWCYCLDFLDKNIAYIGAEYNPYDNYKWSFEIWILKEFSMNQSWHRIYSIEPTHILFDMSPLGFSKHMEFLLLGRGDCSYGIGQIYLLNLATKGEKYTLFQGFDMEFDRYLHYNKSLLSLENEDAN